MSTIPIKEEIAIWDTIKQNNGIPNRYLIPFKKDGFGKEEKKRSFSRIFLPLRHKEEDAQIVHPLLI